MLRIFYLILSAFLTFTILHCLSYQVDASDCKKIKDGCEKKATEDLSSCEDAVCAICNLFDNTSQFNQCMKDCIVNCAEIYGSDLFECANRYDACLKGEVLGYIYIQEDLSSDPNYPFVRMHEVQTHCGYKGGVMKKTSGRISFRLKPTRDICVYEVVQKDTKPSEYEDRFVPTNPKKKKSCCDWRFTVQKDYRFSDTPYSPSVNFRKNLSKPFFVSIDSKRRCLQECLNIPHPLAKIDCSDNNWQGLHNNNWPLVSGYQDSLRDVIIFELNIDEKEINRLKENCIKKKR
ncbi:MAG: hypothetical protein FJ242_09105 [Nitrospira sp.]|nr:hypothetical protein [Nitrospira sp.]